MRQLSHRERKYRTKIIQEFHLKKAQQQALDKYVLINKSSYSIVYLSLLTGQALSKLGPAISDLTESFRRLGNYVYSCTVEAFSNLLEALSKPNEF